MALASFEKDEAEIMNAIEVAFKDVSREGGVSFHETIVVDDQGSNAERAKARKKDTDTRWQDVPDSTLAKPGLSLNFLDEIGFRYYVPAYMMLALRQFAGSTSVDSDAPQQVIGALTYYPDERNFELFTQEQSRAIYKFLRFFAEFFEAYDDYPNSAQKAIDNYWHKYA